VHGVLAGPYITNMLDLNNQRQLLTATYARVTPYARQIYGEDFVERSKYVASYFFFFYLQSSMINVASSQKTLLITRKATTCVGVRIGKEKTY
jgi:hypothetical protein